MNCNIIKDLLPSYIDEICSDETKVAVEKHIKNCTECKKHMHMMQQPTKTIVETDVEAAKKPFKRINQKRRLQVMVAILMTFVLTMISYQVVQDVGVVNQFFFPMAHGVADVIDDEEKWQSIRFTHDGIHQQDYVVYDRIFWKKQITNVANNENDVWLRVKDEKGDIVIDEFQLASGTSIELGELKRNMKYTFEIKAPEGQFWINAS